MTLPATSETVPLRTTDEGMILVGNTRVPLETVIWTFQEGASPEEIVLQYSALSLADVYLVIGYYLNHRAEVDQYLAQAEAHSAAIRRENEARFDMAGLRERLLVRRKTQE